MHHVVDEAYGCGGVVVECRFPASGLCPGILTGWCVAEWGVQALGDTIIVKVSAVAFGGEPGFGRMPLAPVRVVKSWDVPLSVKLALEWACAPVVARATQAAESSPRRD
jgi:hypothetical protein